MACNKPLYRIDITEYPVPRRLPRDLDRQRYGGIILSEGMIEEYSRYFPPEAFTPIPCGSCQGCRLQDSFNWALRCQLESQEWEHNYFVTLTYSDLMIPQGNFLDFTGELQNTSLCRDHITLWFKRLRKHFKTHYGHQGLRTFYCGEYGPLTNRPHYHAILFNCPELDLKFERRKGSFDQFTCSDISATWHDPRSKVEYGFHTIQDVSFNTCAYTARYVMKKQKGESVRTQKSFIKEYNASLLPGEDPEIFPRENHFCGMSRNPGIARQYYDRNKREVYCIDKVLYQADYQLFKAKPPRYFDYLYDLDFPEEFAEIKEQRKERAKDYSSQLDLQITETQAEHRARVEEILKRKEAKRCSIL